MEVAKLFQGVAEKFISEHPNEFCKNGIKMIFSPLRRQDSQMVGMMNNIINLIL